MKDLYIIGSGGLAKEILFLINEINQVEKKFRFIGFIDRTAGQLTIGKKKYTIYEEEVILGEVSKYTNFAFGVGTPKLLKIITDKFRNFHFPNLIHPNATGDWANINMGIGNIITAGCSFTTDIEIGSFNLFNLNTTVGHDTIIGSYNIINPGVNVSGSVNVGIINLIGTGSTILQEKTIGNHSIVGANSLVTKDIPDNVIAFGNPCKVIKENNK